MSKGKVYLVGAGPGDPDLITVKGLRLIKNAEVVIYDYLANEEFLKHAQKNAEIIYVGKKGGCHFKTQEEINELLVEKGKKHIVVRLKGGDPFVFGRGGEEAQVLKNANIPFEVVPGVTAAIAVPAYAGIPLSHRDYTASMAFITGHERKDSGKSKINWNSIANFNGTLVFFMGVKNLPHIVSQLLKHGMDQSTPVAIIEWGTTPKQKTITGTLGNITDIAKNSGISPPAIIVVGHVVKLREQLRWYENKPLFGKTIVITRTRAQASKLKEKLSALGAKCVEFPTITIEPPPSWDKCDRAIDQLMEYSWIIFTSANGVKFFFDRLWQKGGDVRKVGSCKIAAIGPATADELKKLWIRVDLVPESYRAEDLANGFSEKEIKGKRILIPRALEAREVLPMTLEKMGAEVDVVPVYRTTLPKDTKKQELAALLRDKKIDCITFTSSSTAKNFFQLLENFDVKNLVKDVTIASIGPITSETLKELGINVNITANNYTIDGLCDAIVRYFSA